MERDDKRLKDPKCSEMGITDPQPIQEYEFFVHGGVGGAEAAPSREQNAKGIKGKKSEPGKNGIFFSSRDETEA